MATWLKYNCTYTRNSTYTETDWVESYDGGRPLDSTCQGYTNYNIYRDDSGTYVYSLVQPTKTLSNTNLGTVYNWREGTAGKTIIQTEFWVDPIPGTTDPNWVTEWEKTITTRYTSDYYYKIGSEVGTVNTTGSEYPDATNGYTYVADYSGYIIMRNSRNYNYYAYKLTEDSEDPGDLEDPTTPTTGAHNIYFGREKEFPIYDTTEYNIGTSNISEHFTVTNGSYYFAGSGSVFTSNNGGKANSEASTTLTALTDMDISFDYSYSSEATYDKFTLIVGDKTVENMVSGVTTNKSYTGSLKAGQMITFKYSKDNSQNKNDDKCTFSNMIITPKVEIAREIRSVAHEATKFYFGDFRGRAQKVTKGYIGDRNGIAQIFYLAHTHAYIDQSEYFFDDAENADQHYHYKVCDCGDKITVWEDHEIRTESRSATCTTSGYSYKVCQTCDKEYYYYTYGALGHDWDRVVDYKLATCTEDGYETEGCSRCTATRTETLYAPGHKIETVEYVSLEPTCTEEGRMNYSDECSVCGEEIGGWSDPIPALGHDPRMELFEATCTEGAYTQDFCTRCGYTTGLKHDVPGVGPKGHSYKSVVTAPTCGDRGYTTYTCSVCGDSYVSNYTNPTNAHVLDERTRTCKVCGLPYLEW